MELFIGILALLGIAYTGLMQLALIVIGLVFFFLVVIWPIISLIIVEVGSTLEANKMYKQQLKKEQKAKENQ